MIKCMLNNGEGSIELEGSKISIMADLTILVAHILNDLNLKDVEIAHFFEMTLFSIEQIKNEK